MDTPFPTFRVMKVGRDESRVTLRGTVSATRFGREGWVGDGHCGYLKRGGFVVSGRWHDGGHRWSFVLDRFEDLTGLDGAPTLEVLDGYWGEKAELVLDTTVVWTGHQWIDAADHDHCAICWATISTRENGEHFKSGRGDAVCVPCYSHYVRKRALGFIPSATQGGDAAVRPPSGH